MDSRVQLKSRFSVGQRVGEADFAALIESLAHLTEDVSSGALATGEQITTLSDSITALQTLANSTKTEFDSYIGSHPTLTEVQDLQHDTEQTIGADVTALNNTLDAKIQTNANSISTLGIEFGEFKENTTTGLSLLFQTQAGIPSTYATIESLNDAQTDLNLLIENKANVSHVHPEYLTSADITDFITLSEVPVYAPVSHGHDASEITGLDALFMTPDETLQMINDNKETLSIDAILQQGFYTKDEVEQKFYVARWRTDQVSLFTPTVQDIVQPMLTGATNEIKVSIANVRAEEVSKDNAVRALIASTKAGIEVSINNARFTDEVNRVNSMIARNTLQGNIDSVQANATASIASSQANVLSQLSSVRAEVLAEAQSNTNAIAQAESDANAYTDQKISDLLNGAGAAYDTLKELQDHIVSNDSDAATELTNQIGIVQGQINTNDSDITALQGRATNLEGRATNIEGRATNLEAQDVTFQNDLNTFQTTYDTLLASNNAMTSAYNDLLARVTTLENTAYAQAGYVFP